MKDRQKGIYSKTRGKRRSIDELSRKELVKKLDAICRQILLLRDSDGETFKCISCGKIHEVKGANVSHYASRRYFITRWDLDNIWLSCAYCNKWLAGNLIEYRKRLIEKIGVERVERIERIYKNPAGYSELDLRLMYQEYKKIYEDLKKEKLN